MRTRRLSLFQVSRAGRGLGRRREDAGDRDGEVQLDARHHRAGETHTRAAPLVSFTPLARSLATRAQFGPAGSKTLAKDEFLASVEWPDRSGGFTHHLHVIADDVACLKAYLHSDFHLKDWMAAVGPYGARARTRSPRSRAVPPSRV